MQESLSIHSSPLQFLLSNLQEKKYSGIEARNLLRILTGKKHRQIKLHRLQKVQIWAFGLFVRKTNSL